MSRHTAVAAALLSIPIAAVSACSSPQHASTQPGTTPPVASGSASSSVTSSPSSSGQALTAALKAPDGRQVATATFDFADGYVTVTVKTDTPGILAPGFHGLHIHEIGKCEPNSVAPTGGPPGDFLSAGGHLQAPGHTGKPESGDLTSLEVRQDGSAYLVTTTDAVTRDLLLGPNKTALMLHGVEGGDMPGMPGMPGGAMERVACGVINPAS
ncbi:superoxide dismutase family protein [Mycobacterium sp. Aquia_216]|uniref:superoxide dismutase[Cu-Zn] n=1 Tax=Mycobacterium sp. Aquia_216 TaxID=2991729 RepID=UPI00227C5CB7|nr:superoxide dismutase family protein [Mycobacterium sp. Aquia_216]WAJ43595.1 superoxide dismutase family protein [Mycobacterium sp. Aquia_216]